ncbi:hypothetical protein NBRC111894_774 [Sporolactobacillus inulinus]|uniref:Uncharacterized protein n=1 Tax=Sporolactobacillus inulinus TaxID=2078 RepID=A0A4Y1Z8B0_9BACL|nr:hypothetical protein NBRC111894_774 [Sporolactobacillus inulinus]
MHRSVFCWLDIERDFKESHSDEGNNKAPGDVLPPVLLLHALVISLYFVPPIFPIQSSLDRPFQLKDSADAYP